MHQYLKYESAKPGKVSRRLVAQSLSNIYLGAEHSINRLRKVGRFTVNWSDPSDRTRHKSDEISFEIIEEYLFRNNRFDHKVFGLYEIGSNWLDSSVEFALAQHAVGSDGEAVKIQLAMPFGPEFPLRPLIDREGVLYNSFQNSLATRIVSLHRRLVEQSHQFMKTDWLYDLISMISNSISIVDITLNQLYIKAQYDPLPGWTFDQNVLGSRINRRLLDKLHWIKQITGVSPDNIEEELNALKTLKSLRNHTQHFDPPCFGFTLEDATHWMNMVSSIGWLLHKIRKMIGAQSNEQIIEMILLPTVEFFGDTLFNRERILQENSGYVTTCWQADIEGQPQ